MSQNLWIPFGISVEGASHKRKKKGSFYVGNQDAFASYPNQEMINSEGGKKMPSIIAVSDGHGGKKYIRSAIGSKKAVECIMSIAKENLQLSSNMRSNDLTDIVRHIKSRYLLSWYENIDKHFKQSVAFSDDERKFLEENCSQEDYEAVLNNPRVAYGCTFLCAIAYDDLVLILQLGDGDILGLYPNDEVQEIIKSDSRNFANETLSLCSLREPSDITHSILIGDDIPKLLTLTTDGVKNSYNDLSSDIKVFYKIPIVLKNELQKNDFDIDKVKAMAEKWLEKAATNGAGDDVTIGILFHKEVAESQEDTRKDCGIKEIVYEKYNKTNLRNA